MPRKFSWLVFFIILFSSASICLLFIPYQIKKSIDPGYPMLRHGVSNYAPYYLQDVEFPWRSHTQEIFLNISVTQGTISLQIMNGKEYTYHLKGEPFQPYWEVRNTTGFTTNIQMSPPFQGNIFMLFYFEENFIAEEDFIMFYSEIKVSYIRYASSYGLFFLGVAVLLISYYGYRRYKWRSKY